MTLPMPMPKTKTSTKMRTSVLSASVTTVFLLAGSVAGGMYLVGRWPDPGPGPVASVPRPHRLRARRLRW
ncbi:hypothetical protein ABZV61_07985 [Streptomyces sp900116325]|uniref:Secreted protein n=1 Tax=Streptomyces sp. 900116325 TaxID=3154295 RepID=A0ABV2U4G7_9ACTN